MMSDKELFELFRKNQYQHKERPSANTWNRIERKLDNRRSLNRRFAYRSTLSMVAALAALVVVLFLLTITADGEQFDTSKPKYLEELALPASSENDAQSLVNLSNQLRKHPSKAIAEGNGQKKLMPNVAQAD